MLLNLQVWHRPGAVTWADLSRSACCVGSCAGVVHQHGALGHVRTVVWVQCTRELGRVDGHGAGPADGSPRHMPC